MPSFAALDVALGLIFVYLLLSLICTTVNEWVAALMKHRSRTLEEGIRNLLNAQLAGGARKLSEQLYQHPLIKALSRPGGLPTYIPSGTFSMALVDVLTGKTGGSVTFDQIKSAVDSLPASDLKD